MNNKIKVFENAEFGSVRTVTINGEPWFVASDVCKALDIGNPSQAISRLDDDKKVTITTNEGIPGSHIHRYPDSMGLIIHKEENYANKE